MFLIRLFNFLIFLMEALLVSARTEKLSPGSFLIEGRRFWSPFLPFIQVLIPPPPPQFLTVCGCGLGGVWFFPSPRVLQRRVSLERYALSK